MVPDRADISKVGDMPERPYLRLLPDPVARPDLRHPQRRDVAVYRVRVHIDDSEPTIWRRLDVRSDVTLDVLHQILQVAFDWTDSHLHRFSLGGGAFDRQSQLFLCPYDVDNDDWPDDDDEGLPAAETRLDQTLSEPGDVLHYLYDYGDNWELTLRLEEILPAESGCRAAVMIDGERAAPPEDCGHLVDAESLAEVVPDPTLFDGERVNRGFDDAYFVLRDAGIDVRLIELVHQLSDRPQGDDLKHAALTLVGPPPPRANAAESLVAYQWFLDRAQDGGIALTAAGYLKPADVEAASKVVPTMNDWIGKHNREVQCYPLLRFRESMQGLGLLRKYKGTLLLTKAGQAAQRDPEKLWGYVAARMIPSTKGTFELPATLLLLTFAAVSAESTLPFGTVAALMTALGWRHSDGRPVAEPTVRNLPAYDVLMSVTDQPVTPARRNIVSSAAAALARRALGGN